MKNYWKTEDRSWLSVPYVYVDHKDYLADALFVQNQVKMKWKGEMARKASPYRIIFCRVRKKDAEKFEEALGRLPDKMLLLGHRDYPEFCKEVGRMISEGRKVRKRNETVCNIG